MLCCVCVCARRRRRRRPGGDACARKFSYLDHREFKKVVSSFSEELGLPNADVRRIMSEADENDDGYIEYHEFVPLAVDVIDTICAKRAFDAEKAARESEAVDVRLLAAARAGLLWGGPLTAARVTHTHAGVTAVPAARHAPRGVRARHG
jgi:hypothetical protein